MKKMNQGLAGIVLAAACAMGAITVTGARADVMPDASELANDLSGLWHTSWGSESCDVTLRQQGTQISGSYVTTGAPPGAVSGVLNGNVLVGRWEDAQGSSGGFRMVFAPDGRSFIGTWGSGGSVSDGGDWNGRR